MFQRCAAGDVGAWERFLIDYRPLLEALARRGLATAGPVREEDLQDTVGETLARLLRDGGAKMLAYDGRSRLSTWLGLVVLTVVRNRLRAQGRQPRARRIAWDSLPGLPTPPGAAMDEAERHAALGRAVARLSPRDRALLSLVHAEGLSHAQVARMLSMTPGAVAQALFEARARLREILADFA